MTVKISDLTAGTTLTGAEEFEAVQSGASVKLTAAQIKTFAHEENITFRSVVNGFSETFASLQDVMILSNGGTVAAGTVTMPATPLNGQVAHVSAAMTVNALTVSPNVGQSIVGAPTTITPTAPFCLIYNSANATWYRIV
jgi:hypothetical protein